MWVLHKCLSDLESWLFTVCTISLYSEEITRFLVWSCICKKHYIYLHNVLVTLYIFHFCFYLNYHYPHYNVIDTWYVERFCFHNEFFWISCNKFYSFVIECTTLALCNYYINYISHLLYQQCYPHKFFASDM